MRFALLNRLVRRPIRGGARSSTTPFLLDMLDDDGMNVARFFAQATHGPTKSVFDAMLDWTSNVEGFPAREVKDPATSTSKRRAVAKPQSALADLRGSV